MRKFIIYTLGLLAVTAVWTAYWMKQPAANEIRASRSYTEIDAPAEKVWQVLTDTAHYPEWNPYVISANGQLGLGSTLKIKERVGGRTHRHTVLVARFTPQEHLLVWRGSLWPFRLLHWDEGFRVETIDATHSTVTVSRAYQGLLLAAYWKIFNKYDLAAIHDMNAALKSRCEK